MENWIAKAFEQANKEADRVYGIAANIREYLDKNTPCLLSNWSKVVGKEKAIRFAKKLQEDDEFSEMVETLTEYFFTAGYIFRQLEEKIKKK